MPTFFNEVISSFFLEELINFRGIPELALSQPMLQCCLIRYTLIAIYMQTLQILPPFLTTHVTMKSGFYLRSTLVFHAIDVRIHSYLDRRKQQ